MARRIVKALADEGLVLKRPLPEGIHCYTLSAAGARFLADTIGIQAKSGASLPLGNTIHRACSNSYVISQMLAGFVVWTEHEIQCGRAPFTSVDGKVPDVLVETEYGLLWVEVENAWKNRKEREKVVRFCTRHLGVLPDNGLTQLARGHYLFRVVIVGTCQEALRAMVRSFEDAHSLHKLSESHASDIEPVLLPVGKSLVAASVQSARSLWYDELGPTINN